MKAKLLLFSLMFSLVSIAQEDSISGEKSIGSISTDRPVQSETPTVVPKGFFQFELGGLYEQGSDISMTNAIFESGTTRSNLLYIPNLLIKYGLTGRLELRLATDYLSSETIDNFSGKESVYYESRLTHPLIGMKYAILREDGSMPNLTFSLQSQLPFWSIDDFEELNLHSRLTLGKSLTENWYFITGLGYSGYEISDGSTFYVIQTGYSFGKFTTVVEFYGKRLTYQNQNAINAALVYLLNDNNQVDFSLGKGFGNNFYDYYLAIGYSLRLKT